MPCLARLHADLHCRAAELRQAKHPVSMRSGGAHRSGARMARQRGSALCEALQRQAVLPVSAGVPLREALLPWVPLAISPCIASAP